MIVRLTQLDGKLPNLALMRLSAWHRDRGDEVVFSRSPYRQLGEPCYGRVYGSAIFSFSAKRVERLRAEFPEAIVGGSWLPATPDSPTVENVTGSAATEVDYSLYPSFTASLGFTQRGCRFSCHFCDVPRKEGKPRAAGTVADIWRGPDFPRHLHLLDNDFFGVPKSVWRERIREMRDGGFKVCLNQGVNIRVVNEEAAEALASLDYRDDGFKKRRLYTAWDSLGDERVFFRGIEKLERAGIPPSHLLVYILVGEAPGETWGDVLYRFTRMFERGMRPYPMIYGDRLRTLPLGDAPTRIATRRLTLADFQRWAIRFAKLGVPFVEYDRSAKGWADDHPELDLFAPMT
jgi:hypothetical protein